MTKAVLIEDEPISLENLKNMLAEHCPDVEIIATGGSNAQAMAIFENPNLKPNVVFLDISLPDGLIFNALKELDDWDFDIIFVTAFEEYAVRAFQLAAIDYITKPIDPEDLKRAVSRIRNGKSSRTKERLEIVKDQFINPNLYDKIAISALDGSHFVRLRDIIRMEGYDNYTHIFLKDEKFTASRTMLHFEDMLRPLNFFRVHKKHLVNLNHIKAFKREDGGTLIMEDGTKLEVARRRKPDFFDAVRRLENVVADF